MKFIFRKFTKQMFLNPSFLSVIEGTFFEHLNAFLFFLSIKEQ